MWAIEASPDPKVAYRGGVVSFYYRLYYCSRNALSPTGDSRVDGTISADVDDRLSLCLELMSAARRSSSQRYSGARLCTQRYRRGPYSLYMYSIRCGTRNQCRSRRSGVTLSTLHFEKVRRAAAFKTDCNLSNM